MRVVLQRVTEARVEVADSIVGEIGHGVLVLVAVGKLDTESDAEHLSKKILNLRIFADEEGRMNRSVLQTSGSLLVISQFTLYANTAKGTRPSFDRAAPAEAAKRIYNYFIAELRKTCFNVATGAFQASMKVTLVNDGPVTVICDSDGVSGD